MATKSKKIAAAKKTVKKAVAKKPAAKAAKAKAAAEAGAPKAGSKKAKLLAMLSGKGSTNTDLCKALGWLPHTLRAAISRLEKVEHSRVDGVTTYRIGA